MGNNKTDMLTPEQFNELKSKGALKDQNCLKYAVGNPEMWISSYWFPDDAGRAFEKKAADEIGFKLKQVRSISELNGKTGFIVYGFYHGYNAYGRFSKYEDYHVVRVNSDGTIVHVPGENKSAEYINREEIDDNGVFSDYQKKCKITIFELEEEKNKDISKISQRKEAVLSAISRLLQKLPSSTIDGSNLISQLDGIKEILDTSDCLNSSDINILLQKAITLAKENNIKLDKDDYVQ